MVDVVPVGIVVPFDSVDKGGHHAYQALFEDHPEGEGVVVDLDRY